MVNRDRNEASQRRTPKPDVNFPIVAAERPGFPFRLFLPLMQLLLCLVLLWPHLPVLRNELSLAIRDLGAKILGTEQPSDKQELVFEVTPFARDQLSDISLTRLTAPLALNIPVGFLQAPLLFAGPSAFEWTPRGMMIREWWAVSWPLVGMIFWWMAGRAMEALSAGVRYQKMTRDSERQASGIIQPPLHRIELLVALSLIAAGSVTCYRLASGDNVLGFAPDPLLAAGGGLWAVLGLLIVSAVLVQARVRHMERQNRMAASQAV